MTYLYTFGVFCILQWVFDVAHKWWHGHEEALRRTRCGAWVIFVTHPIVLSSTHDWVIYLVGEIHTFAFGH